ncbi:hypothetical protein BJ138DRAFT_1166808 [Hygrophoropsis aurantiaca]|uniref:Uncharacterized protein n=1 Tax=Hygrophoropsis aurantiaca TaxID=72124 RepID=A0ACB7ZU94_9AGAM|nr:hypothetical protein BJ138DRAFT_1166808 [Hygrophoropsis aurantiaca]
MARTPVLKWLVSVAGRLAILALSKIIYNHSPCETTPANHNAHAQGNILLGEAWLKPDLNAPTLDPMVQIRLFSVPDPLEPPPKASGPIRSHNSRTSF